jgi:hypothetical protein
MMTMSGFAGRQEGRREPLLLAALNHASAPHPSGIARSVLTGLRRAQTERMRSFDGPYVFLQFQTLAALRM